MTIAEKVAQYLLSVSAIKLSPAAPFKWSSGWNSPIYCDNRLTLSYPEVRSYIKNQLVELVKAKFPEAEAIAGVATAGIPQGALIADALNLPFIYVRPKPKDHGMENLIEGKVTVGQKVVLVEDLISTGGSSLKAAEALASKGFEVMGMVAIFTYGFKTADDNFDKAELPLYTLSNYATLVSLCQQQGLFNEELINSLTKWSQNPAEWSN
jgi:orotate phosphoribosyltransferase